MLVEMLPPPGPGTKYGPPCVKGKVLILCFDGIGNKFGEVSVEELLSNSLPNLLVESMKV
jgi:hypothetical protein